MFQITISRLKFMYILFSCVNMLSYILGISWDWKFTMISFAMVFILLVMTIYITWQNNRVFNNRKMIMELLVIKLTIVSLIVAIFSFVFCKYNIIQDIILHSQQAQNIVYNLIASAIIFACWLPYKQFNDIMNDYRHQYYDFKEKVFFPVNEVMRQFYDNTIDANQARRKIYNILFSQNNLLPRLLTKNLSFLSDKGYLQYVGLCMKEFLAIVDSEMNHQRNFGKQKYDFLVYWTYFANDRVNPKMIYYVYDNFTLNKKGRMIRK